MNSIRARGAAVWTMSIGVVAGFVAAIVSPDYLAAAGSLSALVASVWLMHRTIRAFDFKNVTIPSVWYLTFALTIYAPSFLIGLMRLSPEGYPYRIEPGPHLGILLFSVSSVLITVPIGILIANRIFRFRIDEVKTYFVAPTEERIRESHIMAYAVAIAAALAVSGSYFLDLMAQVGTVPLFELFKLHGNSLAQLRVGSLVALNSPWRYVYAIMFSTVFPFLSAATFGYFLFTRKRHWLWMFILVFFVGALSSSASTARSGTTVILAVTLILWYLYAGGKVNRKVLLLSLVAISVFPVAITMTLYRIDLLYALKVISIRLSYTPAYIQYLYFLLVPNRLGFLHGRTSPSLSWLTGQDYFNMPEYVIRFPYPNAPTHASASGPFVGDLYANFGVSGVLLGGIAAGIMMQSLQIWLVRRRKTVPNLAAYAFLLYVSWTLTYKPLQVVVWSGGVVFVFLVSFVLVVLETILRIRGSLGHELAAAR